MTERSLAIIGGGASAALLLAHLARREGASNLSIDIYDRAGAFARGVAYSTPHLCHLLNVRASNMSALADTPDDFANWAAGHGYEPADFVPRKLYGDYLAEHFERARQNLSVSLVTEDAICAGNTVNGKQYDVVVQATGNCIPLRPRLDGEVKGYYDSPWHVDYTALRDHKTIVLIGSGLSAVDAILALDTHGYGGNIVVVSRRILFPTMHVQAPAHPAFIDDLPRTARAALRLVRAEIERTDAPWQSVIDSLRPLTNPIWQVWDDAQQQIFMKHLFTYWNIHRHRMAPQIAQKIEALEVQGRLVRYRAPVLSVVSGPCVVTARGELRADAVINCLGYRYNERPVDTPYKIGPARFGPLFETTAIPEIRAQAAALAAEICS